MQKYLQVLHQFTDFTVKGTFQERVKPPCLKIAGRSQQIKQVSPSILAFISAVGSPSTHHYRRHFRLDDRRTRARWRAEFSHRPNVKDRFGSWFRLVTKVPPEKFACGRARLKNVSATVVTEPRCPFRCIFNER
jgi:hypothetical protein